MTGINRLLTGRVLRIAGAVSAVAVVSIVAGSNTALANNDPHRSNPIIPPQPMAAGVYCAFQVDATFPLNREYVTNPKTLPDGSTEQHSTGSLIVTLTNHTTGKSITTNQGGSGTFITSPDKLTVRIDYQGHTGFFAPNLTAFGFPSNFVITTGLIEATETAANGTVISIQRTPTVDLDVCAALS